MVDLQRIKKHSSIEIILAIISIVGFIKHYFVLINSMYVVNHGLPQELREGVPIKLAVEFAKGNNPYSISYNEINIPVINHYGWFTSFFMSFFIRIGKVFTIARPEIICTIVTLGVVAIGCLAFGCAVYTKTSNLFLASLASEISLSCYWRLGFNGGNFPDTYGLTLSLILLCIVEKDIKKSKYRYPVYILLVLLMFYTKQYFVLSAVGILIWLIFQNKKIALKYAIAGILTGFLSVMVVNALLPLYFTEALLYSGVTNTSDHSIEYAKTQFQFLYESYKPVFIVIICFIISFLLFLWSKFRNGNTYDLKPKMRQCFRYDIIMLLLGTLACLRIGQNGGAVYSYFLQIWIPYAISVSCVCAGKIIRKDTEQTATVFVMVVLLLTSTTCSSFYTPAYVSEGNLQNWKNAYELLDRYVNENGDNILICDPLSFYAIDNDYDSYDYGSTEYVYYGLLDNVNPTIKKIFPKADWLIERVEATRVEAKNKVENGEFSCLAILEGNPCGITNEFVNETGLYEEVSEMDLQTGAQVWHTYFYVLK